MIGLGGRVTFCRFSLSFGFVIRSFGGEEASGEGSRVTYSFFHASQNTLLRSPAFVYSGVESLREFAAWLRGIDVLEQLQLNLSDESKTRVVSVVNCIVRLHFLP